MAGAQTMLRGCLGGAAALAAAAAVGGCGSTGLLIHSPRNPPGGVSSSDIRVIRGWSDALRTGHIAGAARYFQLPSVLFDGGGPPVEMRTLKQVEVANMALPCGARLLSAHVEGHYVNALFRLTNRAGPGGGQGCGAGTGATARTDFLIRHGRIVQWLRAPDEPGDNGSPASPGGAPAVSA